MSVRKKAATTFTGIVSCSTAEHALLSCSLTEKMRRWLGYAKGNHLSAAECVMSIVRSDTEQGRNG